MTETAPASSSRTAGILQQNCAALSFKTLSNGEKSATANFLSGIVKSIPPMQELFDMAGMQLPSYLGAPKAEEAPAAPEVTAE